MSGSDLHIALYHPEIPQNTGNIGRLCLGIDATLHLVHPLAFDISDKAVRRAGLDYWKHVKLVEHQNAAAFWTWVGERRIFLFSSHGARPYTTIQYQPGDVLLFGRETTGLPKELLEQRESYHIPMTGPIRSINLSNSTAIVAYEAMRQLQPALFVG